MTLSWLSRFVAGNARAGIDERMKMIVAYITAGIQKRPAEGMRGSWHVTDGWASTAQIRRSFADARIRIRVAKRRCRMPTCKSCGNEVDQLVSVKIAGKTKKLCEDCADRAREEAEVAEASESVVQNMMDFKGRR